MDIKKRIGRLEEQAEHYQQLMNEPNGGEDEVGRMLRAIGRRGLAELLRGIDGKTRGLPSKRA